MGSFRQFATMIDRLHSSPDENSGEPIAGPWQAHAADDDTPPSGFSPDDDDAVPGTLTAPQRTIEGGKSPE